MGDEEGVSVAIAHAILDALRDQGVDVDATLASAGIAPADLEDLDGLISVAREEALWHEAIRRGGEDIGLHAARSLQRGRFRGLEFAVRSAPSLRDGFAVLVRFDTLLHGREIFSVEADDDGGLRLVYQSPHEEDPHRRVMSQFAMLGTLELARSATGVPLVPRGVELRQPTARNAPELGRAFGVQVTLGAERDAIEFGPEQLALPMLDADRELASTLERYLEREVEGRQRDDRLEGRVRREIGRQLTAGGVSLEAVSEHLEISPRALQRRLADQDTSYQELLDETRREVAEQLLRQDGVSIAGAAYLLGYSEVSAFHRAFKRWTGLTPGRFRRVSSRSA
ncbi:MAG: AraC family transcriptional regulator [Sandaracinaceae bacterium]|nr:MAG: AraC family transcriptional regulator [Sandaracinaceae bacterium]